MLDHQSRISKVYLDLYFFFLAVGQNNFRKFCYQNCSNGRKKNLKFEAEGREFAKFLISLEQFFQTVKGQNNFW
jgi:hypothetical protein